MRTPKILFLAWLLRMAQAQNTTTTTMNRYRYVTTLSSTIEIAGIDVFDAFQTALRVFSNELGVTYDGITTLSIPGLNLDVSSMPPKLARLAATIPVVKFIEQDQKVYNIPPVDYTSEKDPDGVIPTLTSSETTPYGIEMVGALAVSDESVANRKVCIMDSGYDLGHPDLPTTVTGTDVGAGPWNEDGFGHGTHVAGTIAAIGGNNQGIVGVNRNGLLGIHIVRVFNAEGVWWASDLVGLLQDCANSGANVVSMSFGHFDPLQFEREAYKSYYENNDMLLIAAAGNHGTSEYSWPASYDSVVSVAAVDSFKGVASFSAFNDKVELSAPGVHVLSTLPGGKYDYWDGTSMACPHVSAVAALVWSLFPDMTAAEIRGALQASAEDLGPGSGRDVDYGYGLVRADLAVEFLRSGQPVPTPAPTPDSTSPNDECVDDPSDWADADGDDCSTRWYSSVFLCRTFGNFNADQKYGKTANEVCCGCGGGSGGCTDDNWVDEYGDGCDWYENDGYCAIYGGSFENNGKTANDACCACQGVATTSIQALDKDSPRVDRATIEPIDIENTSSTGGDIDDTSSAGGVTARLMCYMFFVSGAMLVFLV